MSDIADSIENDKGIGRCSTVYFSSSCKLDYCQSTECSRKLAQEKEIKNFKSTFGKVSILVLVHLLVL
jgi:hypothetical protein